MISRSAARKVRLLGAASLVAPGWLGAQAWLPPKGTMTAALSLRTAYIENHAQAGEELDRGHTRHNTGQLNLGYALSDRLFLDASIPYVSSEYHGDFPHRSTETEVVDDSEYHGFFTDYRIELRVAALSSRVVVTPFAAYSRPSNDYPTLSHAAPASGLEEYSLGVYLGRALDFAIPDSYFQARLGYVWPEKVLGISHDRAEAALEIGYFLTPSFSISVLGTWYQTYGGWTFAEFPPPSDPNWIAHDRLWRTDATRVGAGFAYSFGPTWGVYGSYLTSVHANEGHVVEDSFLLGISVGWLRSSAIREGDP